MWNYIYPDELYHHGVKGQKWGVRRYQNADGTLTAAGKRRQYKEIKEERKRLEDEERNLLFKKYDVEGKVTSVIEYGKKHRLDLDDGGGGSARARDKYVDMWDDVYRLKDKIVDEVEVNVSRKLNSKFGEQTINDFEKHETRMQNAKNAVATCAILSIPVVLLGAGLAMVTPDMMKTFKK